jgi:hypothetical protein
VQDFEHDIRSAFGGTGFMSEEDFESGAHNQTLGDPKAGLSVELDALAAYVSTLDVVPDSPYRDPDGTLTQKGWAGRDVFDRAGCRECHGGPDFTDSPTGVRHDVGTMKIASGQRLGGTLDGFDTPTLRGIWQTAPYLHDGSAETLFDALATPEHGDTEDLTDDEQAELVAYLLQIDNVSFEGEQELPPTEDAGAPDAQPDGPGEAGLATDAGAAKRSIPSTRSDGSCACRASASSVPTRRAAWLALAAIAVAGRRRRRSRAARADRCARPRILGVFHAVSGASGERREPATTENEP